MKKLKKLLLATLLCTGLFSCSAGINGVDQNKVFGNLEAENVETKSFSNKYLCFTLTTGGQSELVKILNLKTRETVSLPVPGFVVGMEADLENDIIYVNAKSTDSKYYSLYKLDIKSRRINRILSFSQLGIIPTDFIVDDNKVLVSGKRGGMGTFYGNDLSKNEWFAVANNISPGRIEFGFNQNDFHVVSFDDEYITRTIVNVKNKQIKARRTLPHLIPFGNNVFIPSPHGSYVYVLHQLKDKFIPYAFNMKQGTVARFDEVHTGSGLLYSSIVSNDGKNLFANVDREIYHYNLQGTQLNSMPKIELKITESRNMAMAADNRTLYITHETGTNLSVVKFSANYKEYTVSPMYVGGSTNQVFIF